MAKNTVKTDFIVDDKGSIKKLGKESDKAAKSTQNLANSARTADRNIKGVAATSSSGTKNFSKMSQGIGGLVGAYATLAANIFAITAAFGFLKRAADLRVLTEGQEAFAMKTGQSLSLLTSKVQEATGGLLKFDEAAQAVSIGTAAGLDPTQITGLADVAKKASMALGRDLTDSFNRLTRGAIKAEPELLDELGIILRLETASQKYAAALKINAADLTTFQKQQAVVNEVLEQGNVKFDDLGGSVNQIAKLGKAFDDLIKKIQKGIGPIAEFIGGALSNNITALAGVFALLGTSITKSLAGAPPALADISDGAEAARKELAQAANPGSATGAKLADPNATLTEKDLGLVERTSRAKHSTIMRYDNLTKEQSIRNVRLIRAQQQMALAQQTTGMKRYFAQFKAELEILKLQHGRVMGSMTMATQMFSRGVNKLLGVAGTLGILFSLIGLLKQFMESLKSPEFKKFLENSRALDRIFQEQNIAVQDLLKSLKDVSTEAAGIEQKFQLLKNISFSNVEGFTLDPLEGTRKRKRGGDKTLFNDEDLERAKKNLESIPEILKSARLQIESLGDSEAAKPLQDILDRLEPSLKRAQEAGGDFGDQFKRNAADQKAFNAETKILTEGINQLANANVEVVKPIEKQRTGLKSLTTAGEEFLTLQKKMRQAPTNFTTFFKILQDMQTGMRDSGVTLFSQLEPDQQQAIKDVMGEQEKGVKLAEIEAKIEERKLEILNAELTLTRKKFEIDTKYEKALRGTTKLVAAQLKIDQKRENTALEIQKIEEKQRLQALAKTPISETQKKIDEDRLALLREQLITLEQQQDAQLRVSRAGEQGLESGLQSNISALLKGTESSFKTAIANIAKATLESMADELSKIITEGIMKKVLNRKTVDQKIQTAHQVGGDIVKRKIIEGHAAGAGVPKPDPAPGGTGGDTGGDSDGGTGGDTGGGAADGSGNFMEYLLGKKKDFTTETVGMKPGDGQSGRFTTEARVGGIFGPFVASLKDLFSGDTPFLEGLGNVFKDGLSGFGSLFGDLFSGLFGGGGGGGLGGIGSFVMSLFGGASGGIMTPKGKVSGYSTGGIARGSQRGYPAILHGAEAVVPLPNGKSIPVDMNKGSQQTQNNIVVNVTADGKVNTEGSTGPDMDQMGTAIAAAVQKELQNQKRSGGILNPYGAA